MLSTKSTRIVMARQGDVEVRYTNKDGRGSLELILAGGLLGTAGDEPDPLPASDVSVHLPMDILASAKVDMRLPLPSAGDAGREVVLERANDGGISVSLAEGGSDGEPTPLADFPVAEWDALSCLVWSVVEAGGFF